jgi:hypothetical protein
MPSSKSDTPRRPCGLYTTGRRAITRLLSSWTRTIVAVLVGSGLRPDDSDPDRPERSHVAALGALGWHVTEIRPSIDAPVQWRVTVKRHDGAVEIVVLDAADPDAALEELARYAAADAEEEP